MFTNLHEVAERLRLFRRTYIVHIPQNREQEKKKARHDAGCMRFSYFFACMRLYALCLCICVSEKHLNTYAWCVDGIVLVAKWNRIECFVFIERDHRTHSHTMKREIPFLLPTNTAYSCMCTDTLYLYMHTDRFLSLPPPLAVTLCLSLCVCVSFQKYSFSLIHAVRSPSLVDSRAFSSYL